MNIDELALKVRNKTGFPIFEEDLPKFARALIAEYEKAAGGEPFWYAVVSDKAPVVNKAIRSLEVAEECAAKSSDAYPGVHVVPLYPRPDPRVAELEARLEIDEHGWDGISCRDQTIKWQNIKIAELEAQNAALRVAIEAKSNALSVASRVIEPFKDSATHKIVRDAMWLNPSTELLEARDRKRDAKLLRAVDRYLLDIGDSCSDDPLNELAKRRESGEWQPLLDGE